jgi:hypothetical protein
MLGLMEAFKAGHLPLQEGTTLRSFLSKMMKCKPKRISKKFEGEESELFLKPMAVGSPADSNQNQDIAHF